MLFPRARRLVAGGLLLGAALFSPSAADASDTDSARILSPTADALAPEPSLDVKVRVPAGAKRLTLRVGGRDVSSALHGTGTMRFATVSTAKLAPGGSAVTLGGRAGGKKFFAHQPVVIGRRGPSLLKATPSVKVGGGHAALALNFTERPSRVQITLNGKHVKLLRSLPAGAQTVQLTADDGLKFGRNNVRVDAYNTATGTWGQARLPFRVGRAAPLAAAGPDQRVIAGAKVKLNAAQSRATRRHEPLGYGWSIVSQPKGANATVEHATSVAPRVKTTKPGRYRIRLALTSASRRARAAAAAASTPATDTVTVDAAQSAPPYGIPIQTMATVPWTSNPAYQTIIQGLPIAYGDGNDFDVVGPGMIDYVVLDRSTLAVTQEASMLIQPTQAAVQGALNGFTDDDLVVMYGMQASGSKFTNLGPVDTTTNFTTIFVGDNPTTPIAYNNGLAGDTNGGGLSGVLRASVDVNGDEAFTFAQTNALTFDTKAPDGGNGYAMQFGGGANELPAPVPTSGQGIVISALQANMKTLQINSQYTLTGDAGTDQQTLSALAGKLTDLHDTTPGAVLMLQTYGKPKASTTGWGAVGNALYGFGGTPTLWDALDGSGDYALAGVARDYAQMANAADVRAISAAEASQVASQGSATKTAAPWTGTVRGVFGRGQDGFAIIRSHTSAPLVPSGGVAYPVTDLTSLADAAPQAWPLSDIAHTAALQWISQQIGPLDGTTGKPIGLGNPNANGGCYQPTSWDARAEYCNKNITGAWASTYTNQLATLACPTNGTGFTQAQCQEMVAELNKEFTAIGTVWTFIGNLKAPLVDNQATLTAAFTTAAGAVDKALSVTPPSPSFQMQEMLDLMLGPLQDVDAPESAETFPLMMGLLNSAVDAGLGGLTDDNGNPALAAFDDTKDHIGSDAATRLTKAAGQIDLLGDILVSDYTKLMTTGANAAGAWAISGLSTTQATNVISSASTQWLYRTMVPLAYTQIQVSPTAGPTLDNVNDIACLYGAYPGEYNRWPFVPGATPTLRGGRSGGSLLPASAAYVASAGTNSDGTVTSSNVWTMGNAIGSESFQQPGQSFTDPLFTAINAGGVGLQKDQLFTWGWNAPDIVQFKSLEGTSKLYGANSCPVN